MRVQTEEWRQFIPGVRMYKGKKTCFYNGEILWDEDHGEYLVYSKEEQLSWDVVIVLPGVEVICEVTFADCEKLETVVMADTVRRIEGHAFSNCDSLTYVKLSRNLEYIGIEAFCECSSLISIFIPPSCREIAHFAFTACTKLIILSVPQHTQLGDKVIAWTKLIKASSFETNAIGVYDDSISENVNEWIKNINGDDDQYALHRACSSFNPLSEIIYEIVKRQGLIAFKKKNEIGITPLQYLEANPFAKDIDQSSFVKRYILEMMGEAV
ncbi:leucine-rich repeat domain-containing protein [Chaetoceros tenuissimus]|uniref:Leucine-rich repeat domain-containing protein n=1 Tax=Chaetoceros tenuissimus TaxID=426638 RepID=A0AAD3CQH0_9STRA|nr:leucine-rich repeat domain-containing protein [Chaetoceros tenuissimus]